MNPQQRSNFIHLYLDVFWYGVVAGSAIAFLPVYATRLGATAFQVGLLTSGPAIANLAASLPAARWLERQPLVGATFVTSVWHRLFYLALVPLPWLLPVEAELWALPLIVTLMSVPGAILAIAFNAMFADVVPPAMRGPVVGRRTVLLAVSVCVTSLICGQILDSPAFPFPLNYQIVFGIAVLGAAVSSFHLSRLRSPEHSPPRVYQPLHDMARPGMVRFIDTFRQTAGLRFLTRSGGAPLLRASLLRGPFGAMMAAFLVFYSAQYTGIPIFPLYNVRVLHLTDSAISIGAALFYVGMILSSLRLAALAARFGHKWTMVVGALAIVSFPLLNGLARDATLHWVASFLVGGGGGLLSAGLVNRLMERVPTDDRPAHMAIHNLALNLGILIGAFAGPLLGDWLGLREAMYVAAALRCVGALALLRWG